MPKVYRMIQHYQYWQQYCKSFTVVLICFFLKANTSLLAQGVAPLPRSTPASQGVSAAGISHFLDAVKASGIEFHSLMMVRHGKVIAEGWWNPYRAGLVHTMYSTSKSFTSTAVGFAITEGLLKTDDKVAAFFPEDVPDTLSAFQQQLTVKDLLTMSVGQRPDPTFTVINKNNWVKEFFTLPVLDTPGTKFLYNSLATYMLSAIVQRVTGQRVIDYLQPRLFAPLGIQGITWERSPEGINTGGWGLSLKTEDMAKFGQLYLQQGRWQGRQIIPAAWVKEATTFKIGPAGPNVPAAKEAKDWEQGYCYQFWRCRNNAFRADGAFGQFIIVMPDQDAVVAITCETADMQAELELVWKYLLPAMKNDALPENITETNKLKQQLATLALLPADKSVPQNIARQINGKTFRIAANDAHIQQVSFSFRDNRCRLTLKDDNARYQFDCGLLKWVEGTTQMPGTPPKLTDIAKGNTAGLPPAKVAASYAWKDSVTLEIICRYIESPHKEIITCHFNKQAVTLDFHGSLTALAPPAGKRPTLNGVLESTKVSLVSSSK